MRKVWWLPACLCLLGCRAGKTPDRAEPPSRGPAHRAEAPEEEPEEVIRDPGEALPAPRPGRKPLPAWARELENRDAAARLAAVKKLAAKGPDKEEVITVLADVAAHDDSKSVRRVAAVALLSFGEKARAVLLARQEADRKAKESARGSPVPGKAPLDWLELPDLIVGMDPWFAGILRPAVLLGLKDRDPQFRALAAKAVPPLLKGAVVVPATGRIPEGVIRARQELIDALKAASKDPDEAVRRAAKQGLKEAGVE